MNAIIRLLLGTACILCFAHFTMHDGDDDLVKSKSFTVTKGGSLEVSVGGGDIRIVPWDKNEVSLKARGIDEEDFDGLTWKMTGNTVVVRTRSSWDWSGNVRFEINVPSSFNLDLETSSGNVEVQGTIAGIVKASTSGGDVRCTDIDGDLTMRTSGGDIKAGHVSGEADLNTSGGDIRLAGVKKGLQAKTSGGDITVGDVGGEASVSTSGGNVDVGKVGGRAELITAGGDIDLGGASGAVRVKTAGGDLRILNVRGSIDAKTAGGDVVAELTPDGKGQSRLASAGGMITLYIPENAKATINARIRIQERWRRDGNRKYRIRSDFTGDGAATTEDDDDRLVTGTYQINGGGETISLETVNADIQIRKLTGESHKRE